MVSFYKLFIVLLLMASVALVFNFSFTRVGHSNSLDISKRLVCSLRAGRFHPYFNILLETVFSQFMRPCVHVSYSDFFPYTGYLIFHLLVQPCMSVNNFGVLQLFMCVGHSNSLDILNRLACSLWEFFILILTYYSSQCFSQRSTGSCVLPGHAFYGFMRSTGLGVLGFMRKCVHVSYSDFFPYTGPDFRRCHLLFLARHFSI